MKTLILILISSALINNVVLSQFLGLCPFLGVSKQVKTAAGMGGAVIFVITLSSLCTSVIYNYLLVRFHLEYLNTIVFILVIAALVQFVELFLKKSSPGLYSALGVYLPLITTNCAVLDVYKRQAMDEVNMVVEGVYSAKAALALSRKFYIAMPIVEQVNAVLFDGKTPGEAVKELMLRDKRIESNTLPWE